MFATKKSQAALIVVVLIVVVLLIVFLTKKNNSGFGAAPMMLSNFDAAPMTKSSFGFAVNAQILKNLINTVQSTTVPKISSIGDVDTTGVYNAVNYLNKTQEYLTRDLINWQNKFGKPFTSATALAEARAGYDGSDVAQKILGNGQSRYYWNAMAPRVRFVNDAGPIINYLKASKDLSGLLATARTAAYAGPVTSTAITNANSALGTANNTINAGYAKYGPPVNAMKYMMESFFGMYGATYFPGDTPSDRMTQ